MSVAMKLVRRRSYHLGNVTAVEGELRPDQHIKLDGRLEREDAVLELEKALEGSYLRGGRFSRRDGVAFQLLCGCVQRAGGEALELLEVDRPERRKKGIHKEAGRDGAVSREAQRWPDAYARSLLVADCKQS